MQTRSLRTTGRPQLPPGSSGKRQNLVTYLITVTTDWNIRKRSSCCSQSGKDFVDGEEFYTLLFNEDEGWRRVDLCQAAWESWDTSNPPFSFWKSIYEAPPPPEQESLPKENAESLLRKFLDDEDSQHANVRYILAVMLERKKTLRHTDTQQLESGPVLIYEHTATGEVFLIPDPQLRLEQISDVQQEVAGLLGIEQTAAVTESNDQQQAQA